jgi:quaternary ammonium compound-resistance protein SugE
MFSYPIRMGWIYLAIAGVLEITWALCLKQSRGFTNPPWGIFALIIGVASVAVLALAIRTIPLGTGYAVWTGIGVIGTTIAGIWLFQESASPLRLFFILLIFISIIGLRLTADRPGGPARNSPDREVGDTIDGRIE